MADTSLEGCWKSLGPRESWWPRENTIKIIQLCHDRASVTHPPARVVGTTDGSYFRRLDRVNHGVLLVETMKGWSAIRVRPNCLDALSRRVTGITTDYVP